MSPVSTFPPEPEAAAARIYLLPNLMTAGNLFCGFIAIIRCIQARQFELQAEFLGRTDPAVLAEVGRLLERSSAYYVQAVLLLLGAVVFDSLDGRLARLGGKESLFGKEFDSLADVVSFGVTPALLMFFLILSPAQGVPWFQKVGWFIGFVYLLCGAVRLARFNVLGKPHPSAAASGVPTPGAQDFLGLPIPAAAGVIASLALLVIEHDLQRFAILLPVLALLVAILMVSTIRYPSFKQVDWNYRARFGTAVLVMVLGGAVVLFHEQAIAGVFLGYLFFGVGRHVVWQFQRRTSATRQQPVKPA